MIRVIYLETQPCGSSVKHITHESITESEKFGFIGEKSLALFLSHSLNILPLFVIDVV